MSAPGAVIRHPTYRPEDLREAGETYGLMFAPFGIRFEEPYEKTVTRPWPWKKRGLVDWEEAQRRVERHNNTVLAFRPRNHGIAVLDLDSGPPSDVLDRYGGAMLGHCETARPGGMHFFFAVPEGEKVTDNARWRIGEASGEAKTDGIVFIWNLVTVISVLGMVEFGESDGARLPLDIYEKPQEEEEERRPPPQPSPKTDDDHSLDRVRAYVTAQCRGLRAEQEGGRNNALNKAALSGFSYCMGHGLDTAIAHAEYTAAAQACGLTPSETRATLSSALDAAEPRQLEDRPGRRPSRRHLALVGDDEEPPPDEDEVDDDREFVKVEGVIGRWEATGSKGFRAAMAALGIGFRYNVRNLAKEIRRDGGQWESADDPIMERLREIVGERLKYPLLNRKLSWLRFGAAKWRSAATAACDEVRFDPFLAYLDGLPEWDRIPRIDKLLTDGFTETRDNDPYLLEWASRYPIIGGIQRTMEPGCLLREHPVLIGRKQNTGKSSMYRCLVPDPAMFSDQFPIYEDGQKLVERIGAAVIVEWAEAVGINKRDVETIKAKLSRTNDRVRGVYARNTPERPRRFCVVLTSNDPHPLPPDPSGDSRFVCITVGEGKGAMEDLIEPNRDQYWAEGLIRYKAGLRANLPRKLIEQQTVANEGRQKPDASLEEMINRHVETDGPLTAAQVIETINDAMNPSTEDRWSRSNDPLRAGDRGTTLRVGVTLQALGWFYDDRRRTINGVKGRYYHPPPEDE